ncbi:hypothetical protein [Natronorubrum sp. FCH18a]|uniref:hypothetical protein n=1 Tax=Natronorubrum sp. FCH18a TaxID=3447018 RepID=UPI003F51845C
MATEPEYTDDTEEELQRVLDEVQMLEDDLPQLWNLNNSISELERTVAAYSRIES